MLGDSAAPPNPDTERRALARASERSLRSLMMHRCSSRSLSFHSLHLLAALLFPQPGHHLSGEQEIRLHILAPSIHSLCCLACVSICKPASLTTSLRHVNLRHYHPSILPRDTPRPRRRTLHRLNNARSPFQSGLPSCVGQLGSRFRLRRVPGEDASPSSSSNSTSSLRSHHRKESVGDA